jgi:hypothetical protein
MSSGTDALKVELFKYAHKIILTPIHIYSVLETRTNTTKTQKSYDTASSLFASLAQNSNLTMEAVFFCES